MSFPSISSSTPVYSLELPVNDGVTHQWNVSAPTAIQAFRPLHAQNISNTVVCFITFHKSFYITFSNFINVLILINRYK